MQVKVTMDRLKAGWEDTLREREEFNERKIKNLEEQKDKGVDLILIYMLLYFISLNYAASLQFLCEKLPRIRQ